MSTLVVDRANTHDNNDRVAKILSVTVRRFRGTIGRTNTVSDNEGEVPPEALQHVLVLCVCSLLSGTPSFSFLMRGPDGSESGFGYQVKQAERWLKDVDEGKSVTYPENPGPSATSDPNLIRYGSDTVVDTTAA